MSDLIDRQAAIDAVKDAIISAEQPYAEDALRKLPSAKSERTVKVVSDDVIINVNGYNYHYEEYFCNACKKKVFSRDSYCSHCGAKLDWSGNECTD